MKKLLFLFSFFFLLTIALYAVEPGMNETGNAFVKAFQANDLEGVMALYADDAEMFPPDAMEAVGKEAIRADYKGLMDKFTIQNFKVIESHHETNGNLSFGWGRFTMDMAPKTGGDAVHMEGRFSDVSRKVKGKWQYVIDHASVPFAPAPAPAPNQ